MNFDQIMYQMEESPSIKILRSDNASLILGFLYFAFKKENKLQIPFSELKQLLSQYINSLPDNYKKNFTQSSEYYLNSWADEKHRFIRRYYETNNDEPITEITYDTERAIEWMMGLENQEFVGAKSRFISIFDNLKKLVNDTTIDPEIKIAELKSKRQLIDQEIKKTQQSGEVDRMDGTECRERFLHIIEESRKLTSDFKKIEEIFKELAKGVKTEQLKNAASKGQILSQVLDAYDILENSDQGKSFDAFWNFLISPDQQETFKNLSSKIQEIPEIQGLILQNPQRGYEDALFKLKYNLLKNGQKVLKSKYRLSEELRKLLHQSNLLENKFITNEIAQIKKMTIENINHFIQLNDKNFITLDYLPKVYLAAHRPLWKPKTTGLFTSKSIKNSIININDKNNLIIGQQHVDINGLISNIKTLLKKNNQVSLQDIIEHFPITKGNDEIVSYLTIKDPQIYLTINTKDNCIEIPFKSKWGEGIGILPEVIYSRAN